MLFLTWLEKLEGTYFIDSTAVLYHLARGMTGLFRHYFYRIGNFLIGPFIESSTPFLEAPLKA
jgi:hypothetical protein